MKCPHCGVENADEALYCAACGQSLSEHSELPMEKKKSLPIALIATVAVVAVALVVMVLLLVRQAIPTVESADTDTTAGTPNALADKPAAPDSSDTPLTDEAASGSGSDAGEADAEEVANCYPVTAYTSPALVPEGAMDAQVGAYGDDPITNRDINYYYWGEYYYLLNTYGSYLTMWMDPYSPLGQQAYDASTPDYTWQDYLLDCTKNTIGETRTLVAMAEAEGVLLSDNDSAYLAQMEAELPTYAGQAGYTDVDAYLQASYGPGASMDSFLVFLKDSVVASAYAQQLFYSFQYTEDEINAYYVSGGYANLGLVQDDVRNVNVRHILICPVIDDEGNEDWDAALAQAEALLAQWQASPTEETFASMANTWSEDPGSNTAGGLYANVQQGQMVQAFNDWCFDESRQIGDTGIVETPYGYHIMYFTGWAERPAWMETVEEDMRQEAYSNAIATALAQTEFVLDYHSVVLAAPAGLYE